jgi:hypothetical protein
MHQERPFSPTEESLPMPPSGFPTALSVMSLEMSIQDVAMVSKYGIQLGDSLAGFSSLVVLQISALGRKGSCFCAQSNDFGDCS